MAKVLVMMGSESDRQVMSEAARYLEWFGLEAEVEVASAHRNPARVESLASGAESGEYVCIIAGAGMSAALPGVVAAHTCLPVIGVPLEGGLPGGLDALFSMVQMPAGIPVATMGVGKVGARNAAILAARIAALNDTKIRSRLDQFTAQ